MSEEQYGSSEVSSSAAAAEAHLVNSRGMEEAVVKVGGFGPHGVTNQVRVLATDTPGVLIQWVKNHLKIRSKAI